MYRDWTIAAEKSSNAIVEGLSFEIIREFYLSQHPPIRMSRINYNTALDLAHKQEFDLIDGYGKRWEVKSDRIAIHTGRAFIEHLPHSAFDYLLLFAFLPYVLTRESYLFIHENPHYENAEGGDYGLAKGKFVPLSQLDMLAIWTPRKQLTPTQ